MKFTNKRLLALFMALVMCVGVLSVIILPAQAETVEYVYAGSYIKNWGVRGTVATFMSPNAEKFY